MLNGDNGQGAAIAGTLRQYAVYSASSLVKISEECDLSYVELSTLVCAGVTAWNALVGNAQLQPDQIVLFLSTGGVSIMGQQIAKAAGVVTITTWSSDVPHSSLNQMQRSPLDESSKHLVLWQHDLLVRYKARKLLHLVDTADHNITYDHTLAQNISDPVAWCQSMKLIDPREW